MTTLPVILFTYPESVVGQRLEWYLTLRGIRYDICQVDTKMPRPVLERLDVHYRRIPILAMGLDIYCDSRCTIDHLEWLYAERPRLGADSSKPFERGIERILEAWALDGGLFMKTAQTITPDASLAQSQAWLTDRSELTGVKFDAQALRSNLPVALSNARLHLQIVEDDLLANRRSWLAGGSSPGLSDIHILWILDCMLCPKELMGMVHTNGQWLNNLAYPRMFAWVKRMESAFSEAQAELGQPKTLSDDEVISMIENASL